MFIEKTRARLEGVNSDLVNVILEAISEYGSPVGISEGVRTLAKQKEYLAKGKSKTLNSYHLKGQAVDVYILDDRGNADWSLHKYKAFADIVKRIAESKHLTIIWGGDWKTLSDGPHFEIHLGA